MTGSRAWPRHESDVRGLRQPVLPAAEGQEPSQRACRRTCQAQAPVQGRGRLRPRWKDPKGKTCEWHSQHGEIEKYGKRGKHEGALDPDTGDPRQRPRNGSGSGTLMWTIEAFRADRDDLVFRSTCFPREGHAVALATEIGVTTSEPDHDTVAAHVEVAGVQHVTTLAWCALLRPGDGLVHITLTQPGLFAPPRGVGRRPCRVRSPDLDVKTGSSTGTVSSLPQPGRTCVVTPPTR